MIRSVVFLKKRHTFISRFIGRRVMCFRPAQLADTIFKVLVPQRSVILFDMHASGKEGGQNT